MVSTNIQTSYTALGAVIAALEGTEVSAIGISYDGIEAHALWIDGREELGLVIVKAEDDVIGLAFPSLYLMRQFAKLSPEIQLALRDERASKWLMKKDVEVIVSGHPSAPGYVTVQTRTEVPIQFVSRNEVQLLNGGMSCRPEVLLAICSALNRFLIEPFMASTVLMLGQEFSPEAPLIQEIIHVAAALSRQ